MADPREELLDGLAVLMRDQHGDLEPRRDRAERERLVSSLVAAPAHPRGPTWAGPRLRWAAVPLALAAAVVLTLSWPARHLDYEVTGAELAERGYVRAESSDAHIRFSEGTDITLTEGSVGRLVDVTETGAQVVLEHGHAHLEVTHLDGAHWSVAAGPYAVEVTGTEFDVLWDPSAQQFEVALARGSVHVRGPMVRDGVAMHPGQHLRANLQQRELKLDEPSRAHAPASASTAKGVDDRAAEAGAEVPEQADPSERASATPQLRVPWSRRIAEGEFEIVLAEAEARGVESVLTSASLGEVMALADAARYKGRQGLARRALESVRQRFAGSDAARTAAFLLGRMSEGSPASAITWYDTYLGEAPAGTFAAEALGRKMALLDRSGRRSAARTIAKQYLARYPKGAYAELANQLRK